MPNLHFGSYGANADDFMFSPHVKDDLMPLWEEEEGQLQNVPNKRLRIEQELIFNILFECYWLGLKKPEILEAIQSELQKRSPFYQLTPGFIDML